MQGIIAEMKNKARQLLESSEVNSVLAWKQGDLPYDATPTFFYTINALDEMVYNSFCSSNLNKYLVEHVKKEKEEGKKTGKTLVFLKPCDTYSLNQLLSEHRIDREKVFVIGIACDAMIDVEKLREKGIKGILEIIEENDKLKIRTMYGDKSSTKKDVLLEKCLSCKGKQHKIYDEFIGADLSRKEILSDRYSGVAELELKSADERFAFWRRELSKCIRCNACRNACPACSCLKCIFDNTQSGVSVKVNITDFEENMFHIIRAFHVAGRCSDCGECGRVCPQNIPLHLLNRKFIKDINAFYGDFQAGETADVFSPLLNYDSKDVEPNEISKKGGNN